MKQLRRSYRFFIIIFISILPIMYINLHASDRGAGGEPGSAVYKYHDLNEIRDNDRVRQGQFADRREPRFNCINRSRRASLVHRAKKTVVPVGDRNDGRGAGNSTAVQARTEWRSVSNVTNAAGPQVAKTGAVGGFAGFHDRGFLLDDPLPHPVQGSRSPHRPGYTRNMTVPI